MAGFSAFGDSTAYIFIFERIGFELCNNLYLVAFVFPGPAFVFVAR